jgi:predicted NACHT family NTPase
VHEDNKYWRNQARYAAEDLYRRIEITPALRDLAVNPLMLQIIALVHRDRGTLPERRVEMYKECTDVLLERRDKAKGLEVLLSATKARRVLQPIALWMHSVENRREVSKQELLDFIAPIVSNLRSAISPEELLKSWQERSGIFKGEGDTYFFLHLSFQEYLAAEEIRNTRQVDIFVKNFNKAWWREPTLLAMGLTNPPLFEDFMRALLQKGLHNEEEIAFMLRCIDEAVVKSENLFVSILLQSKSFESKYPALRALEHIATERALVAIKDALNDQDPRIIDAAREILTKLSNSKFVS